MSLALFTNNATTTLAAGITSTATSLSVTGGTGALFPSPTGAQYFRATIMHIVSGAVTALEIVQVTARSTDTFTIVRGQEGTTAAAWSSGDTIALLPTAADFAGFAQFDDLQKQSTNYAPDTGAANAYSVALSPALSAHVVGLPIRWLAGHANTGASTFNDGAGAVALVFPDGSALTSGTISAGGIYVAVWNGTAFQLLTPNLGPYATTSYVSSNYATLADLSAYATLASPTFTGTPKAPTAAAGTSTTQLATTAFVVPGSSLTTNGYRHNADGSIDQWGLVANGGTGPTAVTFPIPFPTACLNVVSQSVNVQATITQSNVTSTGFTSTNGAAGSSTYWHAIGY